MKTVSGGSKARDKKHILKIEKKNYDHFDHPSFLIPSSAEEKIQVGS